MGQRTNKGLCNNYQEGAAEKLELSSKNVDTTPPPKQKKLVLTPLCYVKNNVAPPPSHHPLSLFSENTGKLKNGLSCHHSFNNDKRYYVTSSIEKDVARLIEDLDKAFAKYRGAYHIGSKSKTSEARKRKEQRKNQRTGD